MGENKHIKELDAFAKKYVKEIKQEEISLDFTASLMHKIAVTKIGSPFKVAPLISKKVWFLIVAAVVAIICFSFQFSENESNFLTTLDFSFMYKFQLSSIIEGVSLSTTTYYAFMFFGLMIAVQFVFLKKYFDKQLE